VRPIETIAIVGAGDVGSEIARAALAAGYCIVLEDVWQPRLEQAAAALSKVGHEVCARLVTLSSVEAALRDADLVIEALPDEMEMKIEMFTIFDKFARPNAILASSTAVLSIADMASATFCPERCIGLRFAPRGAKETVLELVHTPETSVATIAACREVGRRMGKEVTLVLEREFSQSR
jgi:3-hydroxybutyryl-CoA dehydrogenase